MDSFGGQHIKMRQVNTEVVVMVEKKRGKREMDAQGCKEDRILSNNFLVERQSLLYRAVNNTES